MAGFTEDDNGFLLNSAGIRLRALARLTEAAEPTQAALESAIAEEHWEHAAAAASNLSELYVTIGDLRQALEIAQQGVHLADKSGNAFMRIVNGTDLADALHQGGRAAEAQPLFGEAEAMQKEHTPEFPLLYSIRGFQYGDLLLAQGKFRDVQNGPTKQLKLRDGTIGFSISPSTTCLWVVPIWP